MRFLAGVKNNEIIHDRFPEIAYSTAERYLFLSRELIMEQVRKEVMPSAPSRQRALWLSDDLDKAVYWKSRFGGESRIAHLSITGVIHRADAALLLAESEPLSVTYEKARAYWRGDLSDNPEPETLFEGTAVVVGVFD